jgi:hypothetical protein
MAEYVVAAQISVQPDVEWVPQESIASGPTYLKHVSYERAVGTYVEVEGIGEVVFDAHGRQQDADANPWAREVVHGLPPIVEEWGPDDWALEAPADARGRWTVPVSGRPVVLLAVAGGNQVFDHWEGEACRGQGARCEVAEPAGRSEIYSIDVEAKAVFFKAPETSDLRTETVEQALAAGMTNPRVRRPNPLGG